MLGLDPDSPTEALLERSLFVHLSLAVPRPQLIIRSPTNQWCLVHMYTPACMYCVCMYVCLSVCMYASLYTYIHTCIHTYIVTHIYIYTYTPAWTYIRKHTANGRRLNMQIFILKLHPQYANPLQDRLTLRSRHRRRRGSPFETSSGSASLHVTANTQLAKLYGKRSFMTTTTFFQGSFSSSKLVEVSASPSRAMARERDSGATAAPSTFLPTRKGLDLYRNTYC